MPTGLKIEVVSPAKWERLRTSGAACDCVTESLGFADPTKQRAYVRDTAIPEVNKYLLNHELDHLLESEGTDECPHGMRHKKFFKEIMAPIALPIIGGLLGGPLGAGFGTLGSIAGAGLGAAAGGAGGAPPPGGDGGKSHP